jgi:hypothetical protein
MHVPQRHPSVLGQRLRERAQRVSRLRRQVATLSAAALIAAWALIAAAGPMGRTAASVTAHAATSQSGGSQSVSGYGAGASPVTTSPS